MIFTHENVCSFLYGVWCIYMLNSPRLLENMLSFPPSISNSGRSGCTLSLRIWENAPARAKSGAWASELWDWPIRVGKGEQVPELCDLEWWPQSIPGCREGCSRTPPRVGSEGEDGCAQAQVWVPKSAGGPGRPLRTGSREGLQEGPPGLLSPSPACVCRESLGHPDRWDPRVPEVSRGLRGPRAEPCRDPW